MYLGSLEMSCYNEIFYLVYALPMDFFRDEIEIRWEKGITLTLD